MKTFKLTTIIAVVLSLVTGCTGNTTATNSHQALACTNSDYLYELLDEEDYLEASEYRVVVDNYIKTGKCETISTEEGTYQVVDNAGDITVIEMSGSVLYVRTADIGLPTTTDFEKDVTTQTTTVTEPTQQVKLNKFKAKTRVFICKDENALIHYYSVVAGGNLNNAIDARLHYERTGQCQNVNEASLSFYIDGYGIRHARIYFWDQNDHQLDVTPYYVNTKYIAS